MIHIFYGILRQYTSDEGTINAIKQDKTLINYIKNKSPKEII